MFTQHHDRLAARIWFNNYADSSGLPAQSKSAAVETTAAKPAAMEPASGKSAEARPADCRPWRCEAAPGWWMNSRNRMAEAVNRSPIIPKIRGVADESR